MRSGLKKVWQFGEQHQCLTPSVGDSNNTLSSSVWAQINPTSLPVNFFSCLDLPAMASYFSLTCSGQVFPINVIFGGIELFTFVLSENLEKLQGPPGDQAISSVAPVEWFAH
jgi:hypothetical protein